MVDGLGVDIKVARSCELIRIWRSVVVVVWEKEMEEVYEVRGVRGVLYDAAEVPVQQVGGDVQ